MRSYKTIYVGRETEEKIIGKWLLHDKSRLLGIFGVGGIGKTTLANKVTEFYGNNFDFVFFQNLRNADPFEKFVSSAIQYFSGSKELNIPPHPDEQLSLLLHYLKHNRCLIVLDNLETVLRQGIQVGHFLDEFSYYGKLLDQIVQSENNSCLIVTSREVPQQIKGASETFSGVNYLTLSGLDNNSAVYWVKKELRVKASDEVINQFVSTYKGHPLAIQWALNLILQIYDGNIERAIRDNLHHVRGDVVNDILEQQFYRLSGLEIHVICLVAGTEPYISMREIRDSIKEMASERELEGAIDSLYMRALIEKNDNLLRIHPLVKSYVWEKYHEYLANIKTATQTPLPNIPVLKEAKSSKKLYRVFISYAREDQKRVIDIYQRLLSMGVNPWMDIYDLLPGEKWELSIQKAIDNADFILVCLSKLSINKRGFLQKEIRFALDSSEKMLDEDIYIIPARLEECEVPTRLSAYNWVDVFENEGFNLLEKALNFEIEKRVLH